MGQGDGRIIGKQWFIQQLAAGEALDTSTSQAYPFLCKMHETTTTLRTSRGEGVAAEVLGRSQSASGMHRCHHWMASMLLESVLVCM